MLSSLTSVPTTWTSACLQGAVAGTAIGASSLVYDSDARADASNIALSLGVFVVAGVALAALAYLGGTIAAGAAAGAVLGTIAARNDDETPFQSFQFFVVLGTALGYCLRSSK